MAEQTHCWVSYQALIVVKTVTESIQFESSQYGLLLIVLSLRHLVLLPVKSVSISSINLVPDVLH